MGDYGRPGVPQVLLMLTDGQSNRGLKLKVDGSKINTADQLHNNNVMVFSIGVGSDTSHEELSKIASDPDGNHLFEVEDYSALEEIRLQIANQVCTETRQVQTLRSMRPYTLGGRNGYHELPAEMPIFGLAEEDLIQGDMFDQGLSHDRLLE